MSKMKNTLCALVMAAGLAVSPKPGIAEQDTEDSVEERADKTEEVQKGEDNEYSVMPVWNYNDRWLKGMAFEIGNSKKKHWFHMGVYYSKPYTVDTNGIIAGELVSIVVGEEVTIETKRRDLYLNPQLGYTLYRNKLDTAWKGFLRPELELRVGAGLGVRIESNTYKYIVDQGLMNEDMELPIPTMSIDSAPVFSVSNIVKAGFISARYTFEVDTDGNVNNIIGVGGRF
jgi:hypothetical protein